MWFEKDLFKGSFSFAIIVARLIFWRGCVDSHGLLQSIAPLIFSKGLRWSTHGLLHSIIPTSYKNEFVYNTKACDNSDILYPVNLNIPHADLYPWKFYVCVWVRVCVLLSFFVLVCALVYAYYISFDVFADFDVCICNAAKIASCNSAIFSSLFESSFRTWHRNNLERVANKDRNARLYSKLMLSRRHNISVR